jgi:hypothetical protein
MRITTHVTMAKKPIAQNFKYFSSVGRELANTYPMVTTREEKKIPPATFHFRKVL